MLKLIVKKVSLKSLYDFFEVLPERDKNKTSKTLRRLKSFLVRNNYESNIRNYQKLYKNYKFPIWVNASTATIFSKNVVSSYCNIYYLYIRNSDNSLDFLGVCFYTPAQDLIFSIKYRKILSALRNLDLSELEKIINKIN